MVVRAAGDEGEAAFEQRGGEGFCVGNDLAGVEAEILGHCLTEADRERRDGVVVRPALKRWNDRLVDAVRQALLGVVLHRPILAEDEAAARAADGLVAG